MLHFAELISSRGDGVHSRSVMDRLAQMAMLHFDFCVAPENVVSEANLLLSF